MECITTTSFSISINGSLEGYFYGKSGIRQGDPLSPYIFVICMEILSSMLNNLQTVHGFHFHPGCDKLKLNHLCFADDLFIFCKGDLDSVKSIMSILNEFHSLSGLKINCAKSDMFCAGIDVAAKTAMLNCLGFKEGRFPMRYLGIPFISRKLQKANYAPLLDRLNSKIDHWANNWLSYAGRMVLVKSVLHAICAFWASIISIPKGVINDIERKFKAFLWKNTGAKIAWKHICYPFKEEGLRIKNLNDVNATFMEKHFWRIYCCRDTL